MADYDPEDDQQVTPPNMLPALDDIVQATGDAPGVQEAAVYLNDYAQRRQLADANNQAGALFEQDMGSFRDGLTQMVQGDPVSLPAALKAVDPMVSGVVTTMPGYDPDQHDAHIDTITRDWKGQLAAAAITSAAERDDGVARRMLDTHGDLLPEGAAEQLGGYIDMQAGARRLDGHVQQMQAARAADTRAQHSMFTYAANLYNPATGSTVFPENWNQTVLADNSVTPGDTATLRRLYGRLALGADAEQSDPFLAAGLVRQIASDGDNPPVRDILGHAADGDLRLADALHLASLTADVGGGRDHAAGLDGLLEDGRTAIMGADPVAGGRAYTRYVNWLLPNYQRTGSVGANPDEPAFLLRGGIGRFMPTAEDMVPAAPREGRRPLREIFGGR